MVGKVLHLWEATGRGVPCHLSRLHLENGKGKNDSLVRCVVILCAAPLITLCI